MVKDAMVVMVVMEDLEAITIAEEMVEVMEEEALGNQVLITTAIQA
jgi:hypothetical protein